MKSVFPSIQKIVQEMHLGLGLPQDQTTIKRRFIHQEMKLETMNVHLSKLLNNIFDEVDFDEEARHAYMVNFGRFSSGYTELFSQVWTHKASQENIVWHLLGYFFTPTMARHMAFWNLNILANLDKGMPRGRFWYLPEFVYPKNPKEVYLPIEQVLDWLCDLIDGGSSDIAKAYDKSLAINKKLDDPTNISRKLDSWRTGTIPDSKGIKEIFNDDLELEFKGVFDIEETLSFEEQYNKALSFINGKNMNNEEIQLQLGKNIPLESDSKEVKEDFICSVKERYQKPTNKTIRTRLLFARMVQNAYIALLKYLFPKVNYKNSSIQENKLLQVFEIYKRIYSLTIEAWNVCGEISTRDTQWEENVYFEQALFDRPEGAFGIDAMTLYEVIRPSYMPYNENIKKCANVLNYIFEQCKDNISLPNLILLSPTDLGTKLKFIEHSINMEEGYQLFSESLKIRKSFEYALNSINKFQLVHNLYSESHRTDFKLAALYRMEKMAKTSIQDIYYHMNYLDYLLNCKHNLSGYDIEQKVSEILSQSRLCSEYQNFKAIFIWFEAKHRLNQREFTQAIQLYKEAADLFNNLHCGSIKGEILREHFSLELYLSPQKVTQNNYENYFRECLDYGLFNENDRIYSFDAFCSYCKDYFSQELYRPYQTVL